MINSDSQLLTPFKDLSVIAHEFPSTYLNVVSLLPQTHLAIST